MEKNGEIRPELTRPEDSADNTSKSTKTASQASSLEEHITKRLSDKAFSKLKDCKQS